MGLTLGAPLALLLGALIALPIMAHMARQTPRDRLRFGAMLLLQRVVRRLRRRRRIKDWLLLLVRAAAVLALCVAVSAPQVSYRGGIPEFGGSGRVVILVDRSMSMSLQDGGSTLAQRAREHAMGVVEDLPATTLVGLVAFANDADRLTPSLTADHDRVISRLSEISGSSERSNLRAALLEARKLLGGEPGEVLLFSDEAGPQIIAEAKGEIEQLVAAGGSVIPLAVRADPARNVAVVSARYGDGLEGGQVTVRIANFGDDPVEVACEVTLPDGASIPIFSDLPPNGEAEEHITIPIEARGGVGRAWCEDPDLPADDERFFHLPTVGASRVLVVDGDPGDTPTLSEIYFLERALAPWGGLKSGVTIDVTTPGGLTELDPEYHRVVFLANVADPRPFGPRLTEFVRQGGNLVISAGDNVTAGRYNAALGAVLPAPFRRPRAIADSGEQGVPVSLPDPELTMFSPFTRAGRSGFSRVRAHTVLTFEQYVDQPDVVTTLLHYENGMPALVERRIGNGRVIVWTGTFDLGWGNLPLQAVFMPMMQRMVGYLGGEAGGGATRITATVGDTVAVPLPNRVLEPTVTGPDGELVRTRVDGSSLLFDPDRPGAYLVQIASAPPFAWVAVNTDPIESDVRPYDSVVSIQRDLDPDLLVQRFDLGIWFMTLAFVGMLVQAGLSMRRA